MYCQSVEKRLATGPSMNLHDITDLDIRNACIELAKDIPVTNDPIIISKIGYPLGSVKKCTYVDGNISLTIRSYLPLNVQSYVAIVQGMSLKYRQEQTKLISNERKQNQEARKLLGLKQSQSGELSLVNDNKR